MMLSELMSEKLRGDVEQYCKKDNRAYRAIYFYLKNNPIAQTEFNSFIKTIPETNFTLEEYLESLVVFYLWLHENNRKADLKRIHGYLSCCTENKQAGTNLPMTLEAMLADYGLEE